MFLRSGILFDAIKYQIVFPAFVEFPDFFIDVIDGILKFPDFGSGVSGWWSKIGEATV